MNYPDDRHDAGQDDGGVSMYMRCPTTNKAKDGRLTVNWWSMSGRSWQPSYWMKPHCYQQSMQWKDS